MKVNQKGIDLIKSFEGFYEKPYRDSKGIPTIGYGTIIYPNGKVVTMSDKKVTHDEALEYLMFEVRTKAMSIYSFLESQKLDLTQNQFSALVSFAYNVGINRVTRSGSIYKALISHKLENVPKGMMKYKYIIKRYGPFKIKKKLRGLERRRIAECALFKSPND